MLRGLAPEFLDDQVEQREFLTGKALLEDERELAALFRKERKITLRAPNVSCEENIGFPRPPTAGRILWHSGAPGGAPDLKNGIDEGPGRLDAIAAIKKRRIAADTIVEERRVSAARRAAKTFTIAKVHRHVSDAHLRSRPFCAERNGDTFIGLNIQNQAIGLNVT